MISQSIAPRPVRVLIAAGGTGGHIFPALHVARALKSLNPAVEIAFIGSGRPLEEKLIDSAGYKRFVIPAVRIMQEGIKGLVSFLFGLPAGFLAVRRIFREFHPDIVMGMGGYVTVLPIIAASVSGLPTWIHEAELHAGLANKLLGLFATKASGAFEGTHLPLRKEVLWTGHPVRPELEGIAESPIPERPQKVLVIGGSQGARALDEAMIEGASILKALQLTLRHQTREENCERLQTVYRAAGVDARVEPFISEMPEALRWADLIVSRAGAGAFAEIGVVNRPSILVPYPFARGGHQRENARSMVNSGKALLIEEGENFPARLLAGLQSIVNPALYRSMREKPFSKRNLTAAKQIAEGLLKLI